MSNCLIYSLKPIFVPTDAKVQVFRYRVLRTNALLIPQRAAHISSRFTAFLA